MFLSVPSLVAAVALVGPASLVSAFPAAPRSVIVPRAAEAIPLGLVGTYTLFAEGAITIGAAAVITGDVVGGVEGYYTNGQVVGKIWGIDRPATTDAEKDMVTAYETGKATEAPVSNTDTFTLAGGTVFEPGVALVLGANSAINLQGGVKPTTVFWIIEGAFGVGAGTFYSGIAITGTSATFGASATLNGAIYSLGPITIGAGATQGRCADSHAATCTYDGATALTCLPAFAVSNGICVVFLLPVPLGKAGCQFVVFSATAITTGAGCSIVGNLGISPTAVAAVTVAAGILPVLLKPYYTGLPDIVGLIYGPGALANQAYNDVVSGYNFAMAQTPSGRTDQYPPSVGGLTLTKGVYRWSGALTLAASTTLTLSGAKGDIFIMQFVALNTGASSTIALEGGVTPDTIYWVGSAALNLGASSAFSGIAFSGAAATVGASVMFNGALYAQAAVVV
ncbi:hypothetical protein RQP46_009013 [Phenoliferia psychrophenolica]